MLKKAKNNIQNEKRETIFKFVEIKTAPKQQ